MSIIKNASDEKINVIYIISKIGIGGTETLIYKIARNLDKRLFSPTIIALNDYIDKNIEDQIISSLKRDNIEVLKLSGSTKNNRIRKIFFIKKNLRGRKNIIIHTNTDIINSIFATQWTKIPMLNTYHMVGFSRRDRIVYRFFMKKRFKRIVAVSQSVKQAIEKLIGIEESKIEVVYNGIEVEKFSEYSDTKVLKRNNQKIVNLLFVGRLTKEKALITLLEAFKSINLVNIKLYIAGDGSLKEELENFVFKNNLKDQVVFLGNISNDKIPQLLWQADVYVMPSLFEGFGISLIEAMASGKPLILSDIDPFKEVLG
ncbi:MAG: glycosyltransferase family 4 protein, partial [Athalassotoga sp.]